MKKLIFAFILIGFACCDTPKEKEAAPNQAPLPAIPANTQAVPPKIAFNSLWGANKAKQMGKAINDILQDANGNYWFASNAEGVFGYDGKTLIQFTTKDGLSDDQVFSIQEDTAGNLWFLTTSGISRFDGKVFTSLPQKSQIQKNDKAQVSNEGLWFGFAGGAYHFFKGDSCYYLRLPKPEMFPKQANTTNVAMPDPRKVNAYTVYTSLKDRKGNVWFGTQTLGVCRYDGKTFTWFTEKGLSGPAIRAIFEDNNGNMWFGNNGSGLFYYDGKTLTNFTEEKGLSNPEFVKSFKSRPGTLARVWSVNEDNLENLWIATCDTGVWRYDGQTLTNYTIKDGLSSNAINIIYKDKNGALWFGTDGAGVCKFNGTAFSKFHF